MTVRVISKRKDKYFHFCARFCASCSIDKVTTFGFVGSIRFLKTKTKRSVLCFKKSFWPSVPRSKARRPAQWKAQPTTRPNASWPPSSQRRRTGGSTTYCSPTRLKHQKPGLGLKNLGFDGFDMSFGNGNLAFSWVFAFTWSFIPSDSQHALKPNLLWALADIASASCCSLSRNCSSAATHVPSGMWLLGFERTGGSLYWCAAKREPTNFPTSKPGEWRTTGECVPMLVCGKWENTATQKNIPASTFAVAQIVSLVVYLETTLRDFGPPLISPKGEAWPGLQKIKQSQRPRHSWQYASNE